MTQLKTGYSEIVYNGIRFYCYKMNPETEEIKIMSMPHPKLSQLSRFGYNTRAKKNASFFVMSTGYINGSEVSDIYDEAVPTTQGFIDVVLKNDGTWEFGNFGYEKYRSDTVKLRYSTGACLLAGGRYSEEYSRACGVGILTDNKIQSCLGIDWNNVPIFITTSPSQPTTPYVLRQFGQAYELNMLFRDDGGGSSQLIVNDKIKNGVTSERALPNCLAIVNKEGCSDSNTNEGDSNTNDGDNNTNEGDDKLLKGIDISKWQNGLDLTKISCDFIIVKATEGIGYVDSCCDKFFQQAVSLGRKVGFYHFARPSNNPISEAEFFYNNTKNYFGKAIPILDWEVEPKGNVAWAKAWLDRVYQLSGVKPMIYMSESVVNAYDWSSVVNGDYGLWVAKYRDNNADYNFDMTNAGNKPSCKWWSFYAMWQWTSSGRLDGYNANLDCNVFYGDGVTWNKYAGIKEPTPTPTTPTEPTPTTPPTDTGADTGKVEEPTDDTTLLKTILELLKKLLSFLGIKDTNV